MGLLFCFSFVEGTSPQMGRPWLFRVFLLSHLLLVKKSVIKPFGRSVPNFASPYGDYNQTVNAEIKKLYGSHRTVNEGYNSKDNFDAYRLRVQNIFSTTKASEVQAWVERAKADKTWLILVYHRVANDPGTYDSYVADFDAQMAAIKASGVQVKTMAEALAITRAQL